MNNRNVDTLSIAKIKNIFSPSVAKHRDASDNSTRSKILNIQDGSRGDKTSETKKKTKTKNTFSRGLGAS